MDSGVAEKLLREFVSFAQAKANLEKKLVRVEGKMFRHGIFFDRNPDVDAETIQKEILKQLGQLCDTQEEGGATFFGESISIMSHKGEEMMRPELVMQFYKHDESGYAFAMLLLTIIAGIKGIARCPACDSIFFQFSQTRNTCSSKCRQKLYRVKFTEEEKAKERRERREEYQIKKETK